MADLRNKEGQPSTSTFPHPTLPSVLSTPASSSAAAMSLDVPMTPLKVSSTFTSNTSGSNTEGMGYSSQEGYDEQQQQQGFDGGEGTFHQLSNIPTLPLTSEKAKPVTQVSLAQQCPTVTVQNIVATCNLGVPIDLKMLAMHARNAEYNPKRFAAAIMRIREPRTTALIFASGKMVITGGRSDEAARLAARKHARIVQKIGFPEVRFLDYRVQNIVGSTDMKFAICLDKLFVDHAQFSTYEPELFPGLIYRMVVPRVVLLVFVSGKMVITGAKRKEDLDDALQQIYPIVRSFKK